MKLNTFYVEGHKFYWINLQKMYKYLLIIRQIFMNVQYERRL